MSRRGTPAGDAKTKQWLYFPEDVLAELEHEAQRLDRSIGWLVRRAWRLARAEVRLLPPRAPGNPTGRSRKEAP